MLAGAMPQAIGQDGARLDRLEEAIKKLQAENAALKSEVAALKGSTGATNRSPFALNAGKAAKVKLGGFIQGNAELGDPGSVDGSFSDNSANPTRGTTKDRIRLRRARLNVSGELFEDFDFKLEGEFEQGDGLTSGRTGFSGTDLFLNWNHFPEAQVKVGQFKSPFGLEHLTSDTALFTAERSLVTSALTQDRQLGVALWGKPLSSLDAQKKDLLDYSFGIFNGNARNTTLNDDDTFMYVGRVGVSPLKTNVGDEALSWRVGANAYTARFAGGTRMSPAGNLLVSPLDGALTPFTPAAAARGTGWGVDQWLTFGPFDLVAEYLEGKYRPRENTGFTEFTANGYYVQPSYFLPALGGRKLQVVGRWESFNPGQTADDDIQSVTAGVNYYINGDALKLMLNYVHTWSEFRETRPGTGDDEFDLLLMRVQLMF